MENKYYTPEIEDLRIGYECEWFGELGRKLVKSNKEWQKFKIISSNSISPTVIKNLRTKYLDKQDIESLGYKTPPYTQCEGYEYYKFLEDSTEVRIILNSYEDCSKITIKYDFEIVFSGNCPSINELKYIQKLLGIK